MINCIDCEHKKDLYILAEPIYREYHDIDTGWFCKKTKRCINLNEISECEYYSKKKNKWGYR